MAKRRRQNAAPTRAERAQDPRLIATEVEAVDDVLVTEETWAIVISPVALDSGDLFAWNAPQPVVFNLVEAKKRLDRAVPRREAIMSRLVRRGDTLRPRSSRIALDCVSDLQAAVFNAFTAIEALANHGISSRTPRMASP